MATKAASNGVLSRISGSVPENWNRTTLIGVVIAFVLVFLIALASWQLAVGIAFAVMVGGFVISRLPAREDADQAGTVAQPRQRNRAESTSSPVENAASRIPMPLLLTVIGIGVISFLFAARMGSLVWAVLPAFVLGVIAWQKDFYLDPDSRSEHLLKLRQVALTVAPFLVLFFAIAVGAMWLKIALLISVIAALWNYGLYTPIGFKPVKLVSSGWVIMVRRRALRHPENWIDVEFMRFDWTDIVELIILVVIIWHVGPGPYIYQMQEIPAAWYLLAWTGIGALAFINTFDRDGSIWETRLYAAIALVGFVERMLTVTAHSGDFYIASTAGMTGWPLIGICLGVIAFQLVILPFRRSRTSTGAGQLYGVTQEFQQVSDDLQTAVVEAKAVSDDESDDN